MPTTFYVATLSKYVLVDAGDETEARTVGQVELQKLVGTTAPVQIRTVRSATANEVEFWEWHLEKVAEEESAR